MKTRTQWFSCTTPPVNLGRYEFRCTWFKPAPIYEGRFNGAWFSTLPSYSRLEGLNVQPINFQWRGLAVKPKSGIKTRSPPAK